MRTTWLDRIVHVRNGEPVDGGVTARPTRQLEGQTRYLKEQFDGLEQYEAIFIRDIEVEADAAVGMPVYLNVNTGRYERALAALAIGSGVLSTADSAAARGIVYTKENPTKATLVRNGYVRNFDLTASAGSAQPAAGRYYLSATDPGAVQSTAMSPSVEILETDGQGNVLVLLDGRNVGGDHYHFRFDLVAVPAGTTIPPAIDERHIIDDADDSLPGWLPADHEIFQSTAPCGAAFGYNLGAHPELARVFPPFPIESYAVFLHQEYEDGRGVELPTGVGGDVILNEDGIWWMRDCYGMAPWPTLYGAESSSSSSGSSSSSSECGPGPCPPNASRRIVLHMSRARALVEPAAVTSLEPAADSPITVTDCNGAVAKTGALFVGFDGALLIESDDAEGSLVFKELSGQKFQRGRVVEAITCPDDSLVLSSAYDTDGVFQGVVAVSVNSADTERQLLPVVIRVDDARMRYDDEVMFLGMPAGQPSSVRFKFNIPPFRVPAGTQARLEAWVLGDTAGDLPDLAVTYRRLPAPGDVPEPLPTSDSTLGFDSPGAVEANEYVALGSDPVTVTAGDVILFSISRAEDDGYSGEVGLLNVVVNITPAE